jgi:hypothetical protein
VDLSPKLNFLSSECWPHRLHCKFQEPLRHWGRDRPIRYSHTRKETVSCSSWMTHSDQRLWAQTASGSGSSPHSAILFAVCPVALFCACELCHLWSGDVGGAIVRTYSANSFNYPCTVQAFDLAAVTSATS